MMTTFGLRLCAASIHRTLEEGGDLAARYDQAKALLCKSFLFSLEVHPNEWSISLKEKHWPKPDCLTVQLARRIPRTEPETLRLLATTIEAMADLKESRGRMAVDQAFRLARV